MSIKEKSSGVNYAGAEVKAVYYSDPEIRLIASAPVPVLRGDLGLRAMKCGNTSILREVH